MQPLPQGLVSPRGRGASAGWKPFSPFGLVLVTQAQSSDPQCWKPWSTSNKLLPKFGLLSNRHSLFGWRTGAYSAGKHWSCRMMLTRSQKWWLSVNQEVWFGVRATSRDTYSPQSGPSQLSSHQTFCSLSSSGAQFDCYPSRLSGTVKYDSWRLEWSKWPLGTRHLGL